MLLLYKRDVLLKFSILNNAKIASNKKSKNLHISAFNLFTAAVNKLAMGLIPYINGDLAHLLHTLTTKPQILVIV